MRVRDRKWSIAGGLLLAVSAGARLSTAQQPVELPPRPMMTAEPVTLPEAGFTMARPVSPEGFDYGYGLADPLAYDCVPYEPNPLRRWKMLHKARCQEAMCGYPEEFIRPPLGATVHGHLDMMKAQGRAARMALYEYDFLPGTDELKPRGRKQLAKIALLVPCTPGTIWIEPSRDGEELDEARRTRVWQHLSAGPIAVSLDQIQTGTPVAKGLNGRESQIINFNRERGMRSLGVSGSSTTGAGSGSGQSGTSMSGSRN